ncbi:MAG: radical SAM family heme chaperone HemW [Planctomycetota bacterium]
MRTRRPAALYVHIPFCVRRCPYCDFAVTEKGAGLEKRYLDALEVEARKRFPRPFRPRTVFVGGGTPTELTQGGLDRLATILHESSDLSRVREFTIEANPGTLAPKKLATLVKMGVTRISLGAQSFEARHLATLGRTHEPADVERSVKAIREAGVRDVNVDLIFGVPGQTEEELARDLERVLALGPDHVSTYGLTYEKGTELFARREKGEVVTVGEERERRLYALLRRGLRAAGFVHYEVSNFGRPGHLCAHNRVYWRNGAYVGIGNSAVSHRLGARIANVRDPVAWIDKVLAKGRGVASIERLDPARKVREQAYLALRTARGIEYARFRRDLDVDARALFQDQVARLEPLGLLHADDERIRLTGRGVAVADRIAVEFL